jgi:hypothetical protein
MRMWRALHAAGRPWPKLDEDEVVDYMILEAVALKVGRADEEARKQAEIEQWQKDRGKELLEQHG